MKLLTFILAYASCSSYSTFSESSSMGESSDESRLVEWWHGEDPYIVDCKTIEGSFFKGECKDMVLPDDVSSDLILMFIDLLQLDSVLKMRQGVIQGNAVEERSMTKLVSKLDWNQTSDLIKLFVAVGAEPHKLLAIEIVKKFPLQLLRVQNLPKLLEIALFNGFPCLLEAVNQSNELLFDCEEIVLHDIVLNGNEDLVGQAVMFLHYFEIALAENDEETPSASTVTIDALRNIAGQIGQEESEIVKMFFELELFKHLNSIVINKLKHDLKYDLKSLMCLRMYNSAIEYMEENEVQEPELRRLILQLCRANDGHGIQLLEEKYVIDESFMVILADLCFKNKYWSALEGVFSLATENAIRAVLGLSFMKSDKKEIQDIRSNYSEYE